MNETFKIYETEQSCKAADELTADRKETETETENESESEIEMRQRKRLLICHNLISDI